AVGLAFREPAVDGGHADAVPFSELELGVVAALEVLEDGRALGVEVLLDADAELALGVAGDRGRARVAVRAGDLGVRAEPVELLPEPLLVPVKGQVAFLELVKREGLGALDAVVAAAEALGLLYRLFDAAFYEPDVGDADGE